MKIDDRRIFGILLLVLGVALLAFGTDATRSVSSSLSQRHYSGPGEKAVWLFIAGGVLGAMGLMETLRSRRAD
jgi:hypothetical protein